MPGVAEAEDASQLASPEPRLRPRQADRSTRGAAQRTVANARAIGPTTLGRRERPVPASAILNRQATMQLEFHQLDRRWEHLRVRQPHRQGRLMASLAESGQQTPIVVVLSPDHRDHYLVIDGYKRIAALGAGRAAAGSDPAASARRSAARRTGHEVSGAGGASQPGALRADGRRFRPAPLRHTASRATLCRLARRLARGPRAHPGRAGTVFENAAAAAGRQLDRGRTRSRTGDGGCHPASS